MISIRYHHWEHTRHAKTVIKILKLVHSRGTLQKFHLCSWHVQSVHLYAFLFNRMQKCIGRTQNELSLYHFYLKDIQISYGGGHCEILWIYLCCKEAVLKTTIAEQLYSHQNQLMLLQEHKKYLFFHLLSFLLLQFADLLMSSIKNHKLLISLNQLTKKNIPTMSGTLEL